MKMRLIQKLCDMIDEEINDAEKYARCALDKKDSDKELAEMFYTLSGEELKHMEMLHKQVVRLIENYRKEEGEPPAPMMAVYDYLHKKSMDHATDVAVMRARYKE